MSEYRLRGIGTGNTVSAMHEPEHHPNEQELANRSLGVQAATREFHGKMVTSLHRSFLETPSKWPRHPFLCLRNDNVGPGDCPRLGLLFDADKFGVPEHRCTVFLLNIMDIGETIQNQQQLLASPHETFPSFDALMKDGWVVD